MHSKLRIRRRSRGKAGRFDSPNGLPWILEFKEPGDLWKRWSVHNTESSAEWERYSIWGGPRPT